LLPCSHVILPKELAKSLQPKRLLAEAEWRALGVQQSRGWANYAIHRPEPHILLFRRELGTDPMTGKVSRRCWLARARRAPPPASRPLSQPPRPHAPSPQPQPPQVNPALRQQALESYAKEFK
jgi:cyclin-dependent kinase regulatory subunit CKS1